MNTIYTVLIQKFKDDPHTPLSSWSNKKKAQEASETYKQDHPGSSTWVVGTPFDEPTAEKGEELEEVFTASYDVAKHSKIVPPVCIKQFNHRWVPQSRKREVTVWNEGNAILVDGASDVHVAQRFIKKVVDSGF